MDILSIAVQLVSVYRKLEGICKLFIDEAAILIDKIGCSEYNAAISCLYDAKISNFPEREFSGAIVLLKSSMEKLDSKNKFKFQGALIIGVCYKLLQEEALSDRYLTLSKTFFQEWLDKNRPRGWLGVIGGPAMRMTAAVKNRISHANFKEEVESFGLKWHGSPIPSILLSNAILMDKDIDTAIQNAFNEYNEYVDNLFMPLPKYWCDKCKEEVVFDKCPTELVYSKYGESGLFIYMRSALMNYKLVTCTKCGNIVFVNSDGKLVPVDTVNDNVLS